MENLTLAAFKEKIYDFGENKEWEYYGSVPCIVDFYADWCGPCKMVSPILEEISKEFEGKLNIYKVNTDQENELAGLFGIQSIPSILFVPMKGKPQMAVGALPKAEIIRAIQEVLEIK